MGNQLPNYANNKSHEELLHELCKMYKHTAEVYQDPASYYKLGSCYQYGRGANINMRKAIVHYDTAARMGNWKAQYHLGDCFRFGYGVSVDHDTAFKYYHMAANQGYIPAYGMVGDYYMDGGGCIERSETEAFKWFELAAKEGLADAQSNLGLLSSSC